MNHPLGDIDDLIKQGRDVRQRSTRQRSRLGLGVSFGVLATWLIFVTVSGHWGRVADQWASALTMVFGSFVAGSTPQGGGAVAFPVFTKVLNIDTSVARSFSLCIQTIGMTTAAASIIINRRTVAWRAVAIAAPIGVVSFVAGALLLGDRSQPFWPSRLPGAYVKVTFTLIVAAMAVIVWLGYRSQIIERIETLASGNWRVTAGIAIAGIIGGVASSLTGSGADVVIYLALVVIVGLAPGVGVPTSVIVMATVSVSGFILFGLVDGQLAIGIANDLVVSVGGESITTADGAVVFGSGPGVAANRYDLFGLWLAAAPVVAFGAPLGAFVSSRVTDRQLVRFVVLLAVVETMSTIIFLNGLLVDPDPALIAYGVVGGVLLISGLLAIRRYRRVLLGLAPVDLDAAFTRQRLDVGPDFRRELSGDDE